MTVGKYKIFSNALVIEFTHIVANAALIITMPFSKL